MKRSMTPFRFGDLGISGFEYGLIAVGIALAVVATVTSLDKLQDRPAVEGGRQAEVAVPPEKSL